MKAVAARLASRRKVRREGDATSIFKNCEPDVLEEAQKRFKDTKNLPEAIAMDEIKFWHNKKLL